MLSVCAGCGMVGVLTGYAFVWIAQYYTGRPQAVLHHLKQSYCQMGTVHLASTVLLALYWNATFSSYPAHVANFLWH